MKTEYAEFAPLDLERANELNDIINRAGRLQEAVLIEPEDRGIVGSSAVDLISPDADVNALARYRRHY